MIHGIGCGGNAWDAMRPAFEAAGWTCEAPTLLPDQRTADNPPASLPGLGFGDYVDAVRAMARRITAETGTKPAMIGHSMGGLIAQVLAASGDVSAAVFLTPAQPKGILAITPGVFWTFANILAKGQKAGRLKSHKVWRTGFNWGVLNCVPKARHDVIYATALYDSGRVYGDIADGIPVDETAIGIPTLTIGAAQDRATPVKAVRQVAAKYAASPVPGDYLEYAGNAHWIVDEPGTDKVTADIIAWLARKAA